MSWTVFLIGVAGCELLAILVAVLWPTSDSGPFWSQPDPDEQSGQPIVTYCPFCWEAFRERHQDWDPPEKPDGIPVSCAEHRLHGPHGVRPCPTPSCAERQVRS